MVVFITRFLEAPHANLLKKPSVIVVDYSMLSLKDHRPDRIGEYYGTGDMVPDLMEFSSGTKCEPHGLDMINDPYEASA